MTTSGLAGDWIFLEMEARFHDGGMRQNVYIGTSGWSYKGWAKTFYPEEVAKNRQFEFYAKQFRTVEINATFYRLPSTKMVCGWRDKAPEGFVFAVKGSRFITHMKKLANLDGAVKEFFDPIRPMQKRVGVVLWQLPPNLQKDVPRLRAFLRKLPRSYHYAVEFRHPSWLDVETFDLLKKQSVAHVSVSSLGMPMNLTVTSDLVYIRFHGLEKGAAHDYSSSGIASLGSAYKKASRGRQDCIRLFQQ